MPDDLPQPPLPDPGISQELREKNGSSSSLGFRLNLRIAATLAVIEEQPYQEIAEALGISAGAVKLRVFRAVRMLRKDLKRQGIEP